MDAAELNMVTLKFAVIVEAPVAVPTSVAPSWAKKLPLIRPSSAGKDATELTPSAGTAKFTISPSSGPDSPKSASGGRETRRSDAATADKRLSSSATKCINTNATVRRNREAVAHLELTVDVADALGKCHVARHDARAVRRHKTERADVDRDERIGVEAVIRRDPHIGRLRHRVAVRRVHHSRKSLEPRVDVRFEGHGSPRSGRPRRSRSSRDSARSSPLSERRSFSAPGRRR